MMNTIISIKKVVPFIIAGIVVILTGYAIRRIMSIKDGIEVDTFKIDDGWGYQVEVNGKVYIYQPFIPGVSDKNSFPDRRSARKTGQLVEQKLKQGINPAVSKEELDNILK